MPYGLLPLILNLVGMTEYKIPKASFDVIKNLIAGWYIAGAYEEPKSNSDVERYTGTNKSTISRNNTFLSNIGILEKDGHHRALTDSGSKVGEALSNDDEREAKRQMVSCLESWEFTDPFESVVNLNQPLTEEELAQQVASITEHELEGRATTGIHALIELYEWAGFLQEQDNHYRWTEPSISGVKDQSPQKQEASTQSNPSSQTSQPDTEASPQSNIPSSMTEPVVSNSLEIQLEISGDANPQNVKKLVKSVRLGLLEDLDEIEQSTEDIEATILEDSGDSDEESEE